MATKKTTRRRVFTMVRECILKSPAFLKIYRTKDIDSIRNMSLDNMISAATLMMKMIIRVKTSQKYEDMI